MKLEVMKQMNAEQPESVLRDLENKRAVKLMKLIQNKKFRLKLDQSLKAGLEELAKEDGAQRGVFFDTSGNARAERVSATAQHDWLYKTKAGQPFKWGINE